MVHREFHALQLIDINPLRVRSNSGQSEHFYVVGCAFYYRELAILRFGPAEFIVLSILYVYYVIELCTPVHCVLCCILRSLIWSSVVCYVL